MQHDDGSKGGGSDERDGRGSLILLRDGQADGDLALSQTGRMKQQRNPNGAASASGVEFAGEEARRLTNRPSAQMANKPSAQQPTLARRVAAEACATALLLAAVVGSGIMGERLADGNVAVALLANTLATGAALFALISTFGDLSGAHFNPAVSLADALQGRLPWRDVPAYLAAQVVGAFAGVAVAHLMFGEPLFSASRHARGGGAQMFAEAVATFGLLCVIRGCARTRAATAPLAIAAYIVAACWFTSSTSFANPAVTIARSLTDTFTGIRPADAPAFIFAQLAGAAAADALFRWLMPAPPEDAVVVVPADNASAESE